MRGRGSSPRRGPRAIGAALPGVRAGAAPATLLGAVQGLWTEVAGPEVAAEAEPVAERAGVVTVACRSAVWAQELDLLGGELLRRLNEVLPADRGPISGLRFTADAARHD
jgi:predicted nucleic acid-binding Zn ribbon protein